MENQPVLEALRMINDKQDNLLNALVTYKTTTDQQVSQLSDRLAVLYGEQILKNPPSPSRQSFSNAGQSSTDVAPVPVFGSLGGYQSDNESETSKKSVSLLSSSPVSRSFLTGRKPPLPSQPVPSNGSFVPIPSEVVLPISSTISTSSEPPLYNHRIILTTYPGQVGINPIPLVWGASDPQSRGPIVASRHPSSIKLRNAIGAHGGSYSIYRALAIAIRDLEPSYKPNLKNTEPVVDIGPFPSWNDPAKIVSIDPWGANVSDFFADEFARNIDIRPTIAITKAHMRLMEIEQLVKEGKLKVDGKFVVSAAGELMVTKGAVDPVWHLPGVAKRFGVDETTLRRALFEDTGGMYPELITRPDLKIFLPPIGNLSIYIFGNPQFLSDPSKRLTLRVHDECNGSDVFGSDICTCRPYLIYGIEEAVREAQNGGVGLIVYFRKEGRALGEVTKYLVYNARKRAEGGDTAENYFLRTENIAGVKDMRFQALMPDVLHYLGIQKIDRMISMSNMKYDAIVGSGIKIIERVEIPDGMLPPDSQVEIDAKIASGYFSMGKKPVDLSHTVGRNWDDINH